MELDKSLLGYLGTTSILNNCTKLGKKSLKESVSIERRVLYRRNGGFDKALSPPPLLDMIRDMGSLVLLKHRKQVRSEIVSNRKLKVAKESTSQVPETTKSSRRQLNVPFFRSASQGPLEQPQSH